MTTIGGLPTDIPIFKAVFNVTCGEQRSRTPASLVIVFKGTTETENNFMLCSQRSGDTTDNVEIHPLSGTVWNNKTKIVMMGPYQQSQFKHFVSQIPAKLVGDEDLIVITDFNMKQQVQFWEPSETIFWVCLAWIIWPAIFWIQGRSCSLGNSKRLECVRDLEIMGHECLARMTSLYNSCPASSQLEHRKHKHAVWGCFEERGYNVWDLCSINRSYRFQYIPCCQSDLRIQSKLTTIWTWI